ncbi:hypothetical protein JOC77_003358 [Peribacillus deserti]|uniref:Uncharacterized protein n=1 Tax=Peribacillus deserti TaxID=673318 RepID=A0ABS2QMC6_9BACI|nr:hypothetical protein [Peribacillus deserti]
MTLTDPQLHADWLAPHTFEWYSQLAKIDGKYSYTWNSSKPEPNRETVFTDKVSELITIQKVLDAGCSSCPLSHFLNI